MNRYCMGTISYRSYHNLGIESAIKNVIDPELIQDGLKLIDLVNFKYADCFGVFAFEAIVKCETLEG